MEVNGKANGLVQAVVTELDALGIHVQVTSEGIGTGDETGQLVATVLDAVYRAERARIMERINEGREEARAKGVKFGRKPIIDRAKLVELRRAGHGAIAIAKTMGIDRSTVYKVVKEESIGVGG